MTIKTIIIILIAGIFNSGCSQIQERFSSQNLEIQTSQAMIYDFIQPRRSKPHPTSIMGLDDKLPAASSYYSASGLYCASSQYGSPIACQIDGTWQELAPVIIPKQLR